MKFKLFQLIFWGIFVDANSLDWSKVPTTEYPATEPVSTTTSATSTIARYASNANQLVPAANVKSQISGATLSTDSCPSFENAQSLSQTQLFKLLVHPCRFDRLQRPEQPKSESGKTPPVDVYLRAYIYYIRNSHTQHLQFQIQALLQMRYVDPRLVFQEVALNRTEPIVGEGDFRNQLWLPHIFFANERDSAILGTHEKDILTSIYPDGTVIISARIQTTLLCSMNLRRFPFDQQQCHTVIESWMYNASDVMLHWEPHTPVTIERPDEQLTEFAMKKSYINETVVNADLENLRHGAFTGVYSSLSFSIVLNRQSGFYLLDYFLPSMMIVAISWVSFWIQGDQGAPRVMLGTATMLTFITLASNQDKTLPKVSYVKATEIWFMGCTTFIFGSLLEFAFVNTIWRQKKHMQFKEVTAKHIFKTTIKKGFAKKQFGVNVTPIHKSNSSPNLEKEEDNFAEPRLKERSHMNYSLRKVEKNQNPEHSSQIIEDFTYSNRAFDCGSIDMKTLKSNPRVTVSVHNDNDIDNNSTIEETKSQQKDHKVTLTTMTPKQIAMWIDRKSRFYFPLSFLLFNIIYWSFVLII